MGQKPPEVNLQKLLIALVLGFSCWWANIVWSRVDTLRVNYMALDNKIDAVHMQLVNEKKSCVSREDFEVDMQKIYSFLGAQELKYIEASKNCLKR